MPTLPLWIDQLLDELAAVTAWSYRPDGQSATEPAALAALALVAHGRAAAAQPAIDWLVRVQGTDGSLGVTAVEAVPAWPTSLVVLAWTAADLSRVAHRYPLRIQAAIDWMLRAEGTVTPRDKNTGHDTTIIGWPWVAGTHSWIEPTSLHLLALKASGYARHPRAREAVRLLVDRQLPRGGFNYGNTTVLGQELLPHVQPTGIALLALAGEASAEGGLEPSFDYLAAVLDASQATASLCWSLQGLAAHGRLPSLYLNWLHASYQRTRQRGPSAHKLSLLALAALGEASPLITLTDRFPTGFAARTHRPRFENAP